MVLLLERTHEPPRVNLKIPGSLAPAPEILNQEVWHQVQETTVLILCWGFWCTLPKNHNLKNVRIPGLDSVRYVSRTSSLPAHQQCVIEQVAHRHIVFPPYQYSGYKSSQ